MPGTPERPPVSLPRPCRLAAAPRAPPAVVGGARVRAAAALCWGDGTGQQQPAWWPRAAAVAGRSGVSEAPGNGFRIDFYFYILFSSLGGPAAEPGPLVGKRVFFEGGTLKGGRSPRRPRGTAGISRVLSVGPHAEGGGGRRHRCEGGCKWDKKGRKKVVCVGGEETVRRGVICTRRGGLAPPARPHEPRACPLRSPPRARPRPARGQFPHGPGAGAGAGRLRRVSRPRRGAASPRPRPCCGRFEAGRGWSLSVCARRGGGRRAKVSGAGAGRGPATPAVAGGPGSGAAAGGAPAWAAVKPGGTASYRSGVPRTRGDTAGTWRVASGARVGPGRSSGGCGAGNAAAPVGSRTAVSLKYS